MVKALLHPVTRHPGAETSENGGLGCFRASHSAKWSWMAADRLYLVVFSGAHRCRFIYCRPLPPDRIRPFGSRLPLRSCRFCSNVHGLTLWPGCRIFVLRCGFGSLLGPTHGRMDGRHSAGNPFKLNICTRCAKWLELSPLDPAATSYRFVASHYATRA